MTHAERTKIINQYHPEDNHIMPQSEEQIHIWLINAMWLAVTNPRARREAIVQRAHHTTDGVIIK